MSAAALPLGANPWIWHSPVTYEALGDVLPRLSAWGFDCVEIPLEHERDWAPASVAKLLDASGLAPAAVIAVMPPGATWSAPIRRPSGSPRTTCTVASTWPGP